MATYEGQLVPRDGGWCLAVTISTRESMWTSPLVRLESGTEESARREGGQMILKLRRVLEMAS